MDSPNFTGGSSKFSRIAAPLTSMLKTSGSIESTTRPGKGGVRVSSDGVDGGSGCSSDFDMTF